MKYIHNLQMVNWPAYPTTKISSFKVPENHLVYYEIYDIIMMNNIHDE